MSKSLHIRDLPDEIHRELLRRAAEGGVSLRAYVIDVLRAHASLPTVDQWLEELRRLPPADGPIDAAEAVRESRAEDDAELARASRR